MATIIIKHGIIADEDKAHKSEKTETFTFIMGVQNGTDSTDNSEDTTD